MKNNTIFVDSDLLWDNISELPYFRGFLRAIEGRFLREISFKEPVLDLGCGDGHFGAKTFPCINLVGIDPSFDTIRSAKQYDFYKGLICCNGNYLPFGQNSYKTVVSNSVLEHIEEVNEVLKEAFRILEEEGRLIITVPNDNFTSNLSVARFFDWLKFSALANSYRKWFNHISRHHHVDHTKVWAERLMSANFKITDSFQYFPPDFLSVLEWGHYFSLPSLIWKVLTGKWILFPSKNNVFLRIIHAFLIKYFMKDPVSEEGAYSLIVAQK